jgi:orotidine-5'-phosphate decarboxylase
MPHAEIMPGRIVRSPLSTRERLIVALDFPAADAAMRMIDRLANTISFYKIGLHLQLAPELNALVDKLKRAEKQIFLDFKYIDIPATVAGAVAMAAGLGVKFITVMAERRIMRAAIEARGDAALKILAVTLLTGTSEEDLHRDYHTSLGVPEFVERRAVEADRARCDGVVASANEIELIHAAVSTDDFLIVTPGIRPAGAARDDQVRTATPYDAIARGADYLVVGRPIIRAAEPRAAAERIIEEMARAPSGAKPRP